MTDRGTLSPALLREIGEARFGPLWVLPTARRLGRSRKTIERWRDGAWPIPEDVWPVLAADLREHRSTLGELLRRLR